MPLAVSKLASAAMLAGVVVSTGAVWTWGDAGLDKAPAPSAAAPASTAAPVPVSPPVEVRGRTAVQGMAAVEATNTLVVDGRRLVLAGIMPVNHVEAVAALGGFLGSAGPVGCHEAAAADTWVCAVAADGSDVGEIAVLSGLAFTGPGAPQRYIDAEKTAKQRKSGIWGAS